MFNDRLQKAIENFVRKSFNSLRLNLIGPESVPKSLIFSFKNFDPKNTLVSNYLTANSINSLDPDSVDKDTVKKLQSIASNYIDSLEQKSIADVSRIVGSRYDDIILIAKRENKDIREVALSEAGQSIMKEIKNELSLQKDRADKAVELLVNHELHNAQNAGALDGIIGASRSLDIPDPTVFKIGVMDEKRCPHCWRLWTMPDQTTPRVYKLSELSGSPGDYRKPDASVSPTHPNCRDVLTILMPGFGFIGGKLSYIGNNHDEYSKQKV